jgi:hypothetical protein
MDTGGGGGVSIYVERRVGLRVFSHPCLNVHIKHDIHANRGSKSVFLAGGTMLKIQSCWLSKFPSLQYLPDGKRLKGRDEERGG